MHSLCAGKNLMQKTDRFLLGFVLGALLLVVMVLVRGRIHRPQRTALVVLDGRWAPCQMVGAMFDRTLT